MFCVGSKIFFEDGRAAVARNADEIGKILSMNAKFSSIGCNADSFSLAVSLSDGKPTEAVWSDDDKREKYALNVDGVDFDDVKKICVLFMSTGERAADFEWKKL